MELEMGELPLDLGDGLLLRWATIDDAEQLGAFNVKIHSDEPDKQETWLADWTKDLMCGSHPTTQASDFTVVVDQKAGDKIVSSLNFISQTWTYDGIPFGVGRIELVGTDPDYRRRGLIRQQMAAVHRKSENQGQLVQAIVGIPYYYRQFGYDMALNFEGGRPYFWARPGNDKPQLEEKYSLRPAEPRDIPVLEELYQQNCADNLIVHERTQEIWTYELFTAHRETPAAFPCSLIEDEDGKVIAYVRYQPRSSRFSLQEFAVAKEHSWREIALFLVRELKKEAGKINLEREKPITLINFSLGETHPVYEALGAQLDKPRKPYAWYIRVADLPGFLRHIAPVLERRLARSVMARHNGLLRLNFYRSTLTLSFENGRISDIGTYEPKHNEDGDALFPDLTFLQLLFGYRSFEQLDLAYVDCYVEKQEAAILLNCLFPRRPSDVCPLA